MIEFLLGFIAALCLVLLVLYLDKHSRPTKVTQLYHLGKITVKKVPEGYDVTIKQDGIKLKAKLSSQGYQNLTRVKYD